ncbi:MAG: methyltransferase domain-containing protein [Actinomycetota bacterium]
MRANTDRAARLAFDSVAAAYSAGRPDVDRSTVARLVALAGWKPGDHVVEIGAGTGQLTLPLARCGIVVTAVEPGAAMAAHLNQRAIDLDGVEVVNASYEEFDTARRVAGVVAANSFHWLDPATAYPRAAGQLNDDGALALVWNFPVAGDDDVQRLLNERAWIEPLQDLRRDLASDTSALERSLADGRREVMASGLFGAPVWEMTTIEEQWTVDQLAKFSASLATTTGRVNLIVERLAALGLDEPIHILNRVYTSVSNRT